MTVAQELSPAAHESALEELFAGPELDVPVAEALGERSLLPQRLAPHLGRPVSFFYPPQRRGWERPYVGAGDRVG